MALASNPKTHIAIVRAMVPPYFRASVQKDEKKNSTLLLFPISA
jgi:hypothetical protein